jgi:hypothetical protein
MFRAKSVDLVGNFSVGFGPIELKFSGNAENDVPYKGNPECHHYSNFRVKSVSQEGMYSVGIVLIMLKLSGQVVGEIG